MTHNEQLIHATGTYFTENSKDTLDMADLAAFTAREANSGIIVPVLEEILGSEERLAIVAAMSYAVSPVFKKLMLHRDQGAGWGLRVHLFTSDVESVHEEPWHEHRWMLGSSVLSGKLHSRNGTVKLVDPVDAPDDAMYAYKVPDKRKTGAVTPVFTGRCVIENSFDHTVPAGFSYGHHVRLAHALTITEPTVTAVLTAPDSRDFASFIEPAPLQFAERPVPTPLSTETAAAYIREALRLIESADTTGPAMKTPYPELLAVTA